MMVRPSLARFRNAVTTKNAAALQVNYPIYQLQGGKVMFIQHT